MLTYLGEGIRCVMPCNVDKDLCTRFKATGYRVAQYRRSPVPTVAEIVRLAYLDVNRTIHGIGADQRQCLKECAARFIRGILSDPPRNQAEFDRHHQEACQQCLTCSSAAGAVIHYGQAQKLLNMALKYLYNESLLDSNPSLPRLPKDVEDFFHIPIDNQILRYLQNDLGLSRPTPLPWSKWNRDQYAALQNDLRDRLGLRHKPLEVDYLVWNSPGFNNRLTKDRRRK